MDFNDVEGEQSLANRGTIAVTGTFVNVSYSDLRPMVNRAGYSGFFGHTTSNYVTFGDLAELDSLWALTICTWMRPTFGGTSRVITKGLTTWDLVMNMSEQMTFQQNATANVKTLGSALTLDEWVFVAVTYDGVLTTNNLIYYAGDGASFTEVTTNTLNQGQCAAVAYPLWFGASPYSTHNAAYWYGGQLDNVRIYDRVKTAAALETIMTFDDAADWRIPGTMVLIK